MQGLSLQYGLVHRGILRLGSGTVHRLWQGPCGIRCDQSTQNPCFASAFGRPGMLPWFGRVVATARLHLSHACFRSIRHFGRVPVVRCALHEVE